jgi:hypothetical protein
LDFERVVEEEIVTGVIFDDHDVKFEFEANWGYVHMPAAAKGVSGAINEEGFDQA